MEVEAQAGFKRADDALLTIPAILRIRGPPWLPRPGLLVKVELASLGSMVLGIEPALGDVLSPPIMALEVERRARGLWGIQDLQRDLHTIFIWICGALVQVAEGDPHAARQGHRPLFHLLVIP